MLTAVTVAMLVVFLALVLSRRVSVLVALVLVPVVFAVLAGFGAQVGDVVATGVATVAPTAALILFAILFFGTLLDAGIFDPLIRLVVRLVGDDPVKVVVATAVLTLSVAVDGDGSSTYIIVVTAMLGIYRRTGLRLEVLATVAVLAAGTATLLPWGGPVIKAAAALDLDVQDVYLPLVVPQLAGAVTVLLVALRLGRQERRRLATLPTGRGAPVPVGAGPYAGADTSSDVDSTAGDDGPSPAGPAGSGAADPSREGAGDDERDPAQREQLARPRLFVVNVALALLVMVPLVAGWVEPVFLFVAGSAVALLINYPRLSDQRDLITRHAPSMIPVTSLIFAAGVFTGVLSETGMAESLALSLTGLVPEGSAGVVPLATAVLAFPLTFLVQQDTFYFGVLPLLAAAGEQLGVDPEVLARASVVAQPLHAFSPTVAALFVLLGLLRLDYGQLFRQGAGYGALVSVVILATALLTGAVPL